MQKHRIVFGAAALAIAAAAAALAMRFPRDQVMNIGPAFFPLCVALALGVLGLCECVLGWRTQAEAPAAEEAPSATGGGTRLVVLLAALCVYAWVLPHAGFLVSTMVLVAGVTWLFGGRHPMLLAANALGIAGGTWLVFGRFLGVGLPIWGG